MGFWIFNVSGVWFLKLHCCVNFKISKIQGSNFIQMFLTFNKVLGMYMNTDFMFIAEVVTNVIAE